MKRGLSIFGGCLLAATLSVPALAGQGRGKGESMAGGLPGLEDRVQKDEALIATLQGQVAVLQSQVTTLQGEVTTLQGQVTTLQGQVATLQGQVTALQGQVTALQGQNNWAVVGADGTLNRSHSSAGVVAAGPITTGQYEVVFSKDVSGCAYSATIGDTGTALPAPGQITVSGDPDSDSHNDVLVQTFDKTGAAANSAFHLYVSCP